MEALTYRSVFEGALGAKRTSFVAAWVDLWRQWEEAGRTRTPGIRVSTSGITAHFHDLDQHHFADTFVLRDFCEEEDLQVGLEAEGSKDPQDDVLYDFLA